MSRLIKESAHLSIVDDLEACRAAISINCKNRIHYLWHTYCLLQSLGEPQLASLDQAFVVKAFMVSEFLTPCPG